MAGQAKSKPKEQDLRDISNASIDAKEALLKQASSDLIFFGRAFLPRDFLHKSESHAFQ